MAEAVKAREFRSGDVHVMSNYLLLPLPVKVDRFQKKTHKVIDPITVS